MRNLKFIIMSAAGGFLLSLFFGIFSHSSFFKVLLTALICAVVFALLGAGIQFLYSKFLDVETSGSFESSSTGASKSSSSTGSTVDLVVQDEELVQTGNSNHYEVGDNHQMLNESDISKKNNFQNFENQNGEFVPLRNSESYKNISGTEAVSNAFYDAASKSENKNTEVSSNDLDVLPDMGVFAKSESTSSNESSENSSYNTFEESSSFVKSIDTSGDDSTAEIKDASLMAKAISSILADEQ